MKRRIVSAASIVVLAAAAWAAPEEAPANPWSDTVRELLRPTCGRCHDSSQPTHKQRALAIFDLEAEVWYENMTKSDIRGLNHRAKDYREEDRRAVSSFVACVIDGACDE